jgi:hypothetical protein
MVRAPNQGTARAYSRVKSATRPSAKRARRHGSPHLTGAILDLRLRGAGSARKRNALLRARGGRVLAAELVHAAGGVDDLLLARVERMAVGAHLDLQVMTERRARLERVAARAGDRDLFVLGVNRRFHGRLGVQCGLTTTWGGKHAS